VSINAADVLDGAGSDLSAYRVADARPGKPIPARTVGSAAPGGGGDIDKAIEAAAKASSWALAAAQARARALFAAGDKLATQADVFADRLKTATGLSARAAAAEVEVSVRRIFSAAGSAEAFDGAHLPTRGKLLTLALNEPWGVVGVVCPDEAPLLAFASLVAPAIALGNRVIAVVSPRHRSVIADFAAVLEASGVPAGVVNVAAGDANALADHDGVDAVWYVGDAAGAARVETGSAGNLKAVWTISTGVDWPNADERDVLSRAARVKTIRAPYGE
jgi:aldehyde dehydrogenase (NAD+)